MKLEDYLDEEFKLLQVAPHITHIRLLPDSYYRVITVAAPYGMAYRDVEQMLAWMFNDAQAKRISNLGTYLIDAFAERHCGVALCHHLDQFIRERGRIIAKGRLLKVLRANRFEADEERYKARLNKLRLQVLEAGA